MEKARIKTDGRMAKCDYERLAHFRYQLRRFLRFSEEVTRKQGVTALQYPLPDHHELHRGLPEGALAVESHRENPASDGQRITLMEDTKLVFIEPLSAVLAEFQQLIKHEADLAKELEALHDLPAETPDGARVVLQANVGLLSDLVPALESSAEGIGLYRTEFTAASCLAGTR